MKLIKFCGLILVISACTQKQKDNSPPKTSEDTLSKKTYIEKKILQEDLKNYDSVKYFKSANWINLKGEDEMVEDKLSFPFLAFAYKKNSFEVIFYFAPENTVSWYFKKYNNIPYLHLKKYVGGDIQDTVHYYLFFKQNENLFIESSDQDFLSKSKVSVRNIIKAVPGGVSTISERYYILSLGRKDLALHDIVNFNEAVLAKAFKIVGNRNIAIKDQKVIQLDDDHKDLVNGEVGSNNNNPVWSPKFPYPSLVFFYAQRYKYMEMVH